MRGFAGAVLAFFLVTQIGASANPPMDGRVVPPEQVQRQEFQGVDILALQSAWAALEAQCSVPPLSAVAIQMIRIDAEHHYSFFFSAPPRTETRNGQTYVEVYSNQFQVVVNDGVVAVVSCR